MGNVIVTQLETKNGEVLLTINLNLNLKLDKEGGLVVNNSVEDTPVEKPKLQKVKFEKPDMEDNSEIIDFGKQV